MFAATGTLLNISNRLANDGKVRIYAHRDWPNSDADPNDVYVFVNNPLCNSRPVMVWIAGKR